MAEKGVPLPPSCAKPTNTVSEQRVAIRLGKQRYDLDITCPASTSPHETEPASRLIKTKFIRLRQPVALGEHIDGWRVCWIGGWDRGKIFFVPIGGGAIGVPLGASLVAMGACGQPASG